VQITGERVILRMDTLSSPPSTSQIARDSPQPLSKESIPLDDSIPDPLSPAPLNLVKPPILVKPPGFSSVIWKHFKLEKGNLKSSGYCNYCKLQVSRGNSNTTTNMKAHLQRKHPEEHAELLVDEEPNSQSISNFYGPTKLHGIKDALIEMMVEGHIPYTMLRLKGLKKLLEVVGCREGVPDKRTVQARMAVIEKQTKCKLKALVAGKKVSLTTDGWKANNNIDYLGITTCWIDDAWKLQTVTLDCTVFPGRHSAARMAERVQYILKG
jgi:BED zinc finger